MANHNFWGASQPSPLGATPQALGAEMMNSPTPQTATPAPSFGQMPSTMDIYRMGQMANQAPPKSKEWTPEQGYANPLGLSPGSNMNSNDLMRIAGDFYGR